MKKFALILLAFLLLFGITFIGCEDSDDDDGVDLTEAQVTEAMTALMEVMEGGMMQVMTVAFEVMMGGAEPEGFELEADLEAGTMTITLTSFGVDIDGDETDDYVLTGTIDGTEAEDGDNTVSSYTMDIAAVGDITVDGTIVMTETETTAEGDFVSSGVSIDVSISGVTDIDGALALVATANMDEDGVSTIATATINGEDYAEMIQGIIDSLMGAPTVVLSRTGDLTIPGNPYATNSQLQMKDIDPATLLMEVGDIFYVEFTATAATAAPGLNFCAIDNGANTGSGYGWHILSENGENTVFAEAFDVGDPLSFSGSIEITEVRTEDGRDYNFFAIETPDWPSEEDKVDVELTDVTLTISTVLD